MLNNLKVKNVIFNEVDEIAGGVFLKTFGLNNQTSLNIKEVNGKFYMVKGGKSKLIDVGTISELVNSSIIGKTLSEIKSNSTLLLLIQELNLIKEITFESVNEEICLFD